MGCGPIALRDIDSKLASMCQRKLLVLSQVVWRMQGPPTHQKMWPYVTTWQNQHTHLAISVALAVLVLVVMWNLVSSWWLECVMM